MSFSLFLFLHQLMQERLERSFDDHRKILNQHDIELLIHYARPELSLRIFESALTDHRPVEGVPYHLNCSVKPLFYHDGHKRAFIAFACAPLAAGLNRKERRRAKRILQELINTDQAGYVQVLAWHSLGQILIEESQSPSLYREEILKAFGQTTPSLLGALVFLEMFFKTDTQQDSIDIIKEGMPRVRYRVQRFLLHYFVYRHAAFPADLRRRVFEERDIQRFFLEKSNQKISFQKHTNEGLKEIGLFGLGQKPVLWEKTSQQAVAQRLIQASEHLLGVIGAFISVLDE